MDLGIENKTAMVTGGSRGLGLQSAISLAREGCKIAICGRGSEDLESTVKEIKDINHCYIKQKEIAQDFSQVFEDSKKDGPHKMKHLDVDPSGESIYTDIYFEMDDNYSVIISCYDYSDHLESQNRVDFLGIVIRSQKFEKWLSKPTK